MIWWMLELHLFKAGKLTRRPIEKFWITKATREVHKQESMINFSKLHLWRKDLRISLQAVDVWWVYKTFHRYRLRNFKSWSDLVWRAWNKVAYCWISCLSRRLRSMVSSSLAMSSGSMQLLESRRLLHSKIEEFFGLSQTLPTHPKLGVDLCCKDRTSDI